MKLLYAVASILIFLAALSKGRREEQTAKWFEALQGGM